VHLRGPWKVATILWQTGPQRTETPAKRASVPLYGRLLLSFSACSLPTLVWYRAVSNQQVRATSTS
jgi:hypothetical protein